MKTIVIIGAGPAGCFAAINAARRNKSYKYILLEATQRPLTKVLLSGGGRCNVTHHEFDVKRLVQNYPRGSKELLGVMTKFGPKELIEWFAHEGVELKTEADGRMFPVTDKSQTIAQCLLHALEKEGVELRKGHKVCGIIRESTGFRIELHNKEALYADRLMLATGSMPDGLKLCEELGHKIEKQVPSLFTFNISNPLLSGLMGQSVSFAELKLKFAETITDQFFLQKGPLLITHWGLSGPAVLKLSAFAARFLHQADYQAEVSINWTGSYKEESCFQLLWDEREKNGNKLLAGTSLFGLSKALWQRLIQEYSEKRWQEISKKSMRLIATSLCNTTFKVEGKGIFKEEFVSCGGISRDEVDFKTMQSKLIPGLFFSGEILDIDGITGGFNFQNAWSGAWLASCGLSV